MVLPGLVIAGLWLTYSASRSPRLPERTYTAVKLFRITAIISLVLYCVSVALILIGIIIIIFIFSFFGVSALELFTSLIEPLSTLSGFLSALAMLIILFFLVGIAAVTVFVIFYFKSAFRLLSAFKDGMLGKPIDKLRGIWMFTVMSGISVGFSLFGILASIGSSGNYSNNLNNSLSPYELLGDIAYEMPVWLQNTYINLFDPDNLSLILISSAVSTALVSTGIIILLVVLHRFNRALKSRLY